MAKPIYVLNGPNLNLLGTREPNIYGKTTLDQVRTLCEARAGEYGRKVVFRQTNHEGELIDWVQEAGEQASGLVLNAAGFTHTSVSLLDALKTLKVPIIECHLSNPHAREPFRRQSFVALAAAGAITGFGPLSYELAVDAALRLAGAVRAAQ
jgi:3-dehydroquinate dehydratase-2